MKTLLYCSLLLLTLSCKKAPSDIVDPEPDTVLAEYPDWYTLTAPVDKEIKGVWGDRDKTVLVTTGFAVFRSTDQGQHWQEVLPQQSIGIFGIVQNQDTLFTMTGLNNQSNGNTYQQVLVHANNYSLDDGITWQPYTKRNPLLDEPRSGQTIDKRLLINPVTASTGTTYRINQVFLDGPSATSGPFETPGVITSDGRRIDLPQLHQLNSLFLDSQQRLYVAGTDAVCGRGGKTGVTSRL
ncbi:hypothetical protein [Spirosoma fluviale]|uniref:BNR/Asp-box repeat-containing protein n=1 Tax=Spirosoma fluviale TaxID=1597977 RepID=A0A286GMC4_9BACT|nr:hypothetical protein [Spirosoma fluviale]SOD96660.1 hypothetical protein SAMN06269250_5432 [Spirosoma fluviale]